MANTLQVNDRVIINIFDKEYHRGDIIIHSTEKKDVVFVKRIVALPGEKVEIKKLQDNSYGIYINGKFVKFKPMIYVGTTTLASNVVNIAIAGKSIAG